MTLILKPLQGGRPIVLDKPIIVIGRHPDCDVVIETSGKISRKHCCVATADRRTIVRDLDSMNGVFVNGRRLPCDQAAEISPGDRLLVGDVPFELVRVGAPRSDEAIPARRDPPRAEPEVRQGKLRVSDVSEAIEQVKLARADAAIEFTNGFRFPAELHEQEDEDLIRLSDG